MALERFVADYELKNRSNNIVSDKTSVNKKLKRVAVIGSGPAGLTAAR